MMLTPRPSVASSKSASSQACETQYQVTSSRDRRRRQRRQYDPSCSRGSWYLWCRRSTSCEICRRCYLAVPILEEVASSSWILELSAIDQVDPLYVILEGFVVVVKLTLRLVLQEHHFCSHAFLGELSGAFEKFMLILQYSWFNDYSGQIAFEGWSMSYYNVIFTILPPLVIGIFDQFVSARMLDRYPQLYQLGQQNYFFTPHTFFYWVGNAFYHSVVSTSHHCCDLS